MSLEQTLKDHAEAMGAVADRIEAAIEKFVEHVLGDDPKTPPPAAAKSAAPKPQPKAPAQTTPAPEADAPTAPDIVAAEPDAVDYATLSKAFLALCSKKGNPVGAKFLADHGLGNTLKAAKESDYPQLLADIQKVAA